MSSPLIDAPAAHSAPSARALPPLSATERVVYACLERLARLPLGFWRNLGVFFGWLAYGVLLIRRDRWRAADTNLRLCFPDQSAQWRRRILLQHCIRLAQSTLDRIWLWHGSEALLRERLHLQGDAGALLQRKPTILFAPHFVGMDAAAMLLIPLLHDRACISIYTPQRNQVFDRWIRRGRGRFPNGLPVWRADGIRPVIAALRKAGVLYLLPDMNFGPQESIFVKFFGHPAATVPSLSRFARLGRAQVMSAITFMGPHGYTVHLGEPWADFPTEDVYADTQRMNTHLEAWIRQRPEEYFWLHKRFKTQPEGMPPVY
ncbi:MAG: lipid A biosynthesis acyltransferase [Brachymonas sp.]|nr:lipid A biosynthesis acyltransferase [Brachymonas sp.]